jgi:hypothetical protein
MGTEIKLNTILYRYTVHNGKLIVREGIVSNYGLRTCVHFTDGSTAVRTPRPEDIGVMKPVGHSIWLTERDDEKARRMFIEFEERRIVELEETLRKKREVVEQLKDEARMS